MKEEKKGEKTGKKDVENKAAAIQSQKEVKLKERAREKELALQRTDRKREHLDRPKRDGRFADANDRGEG